MIAPPVPLAAWALSPDVVHLNHGSFGGCLRSVLAVATAARERLEAAPMRYFVLDWQSELDHARAAVAEFFGAPAERFAFVPNATSGVAVALAAAQLAAGDEILTTAHVYPACKNQLARLAERTGARIVTVPVALPFDPDALVDAVAAALTPRTRLALLDHITSPTALVLPLARLVPLLAARGIPILVDGAHAPGQVPLDVGALLAAGVTWYVGNHHKWLCAPKASGFLAVAPEAAARTLPLVTSHGATATYGPANRFHAELDWSGTYDPSAQLAVPAAIADVGALGGGWPAILERNHALVLAMRERLGGTPIAPADCIGTMAAVRIQVTSGVAPSAIEKRLLADGWEVPIVVSASGLLLRVSAHLYNSLDPIDGLLTQLSSLGVRVCA